VLGCGVAHAAGTEPDEGLAAAPPEQDEPSCEQKWGCLDLLHTSPGSVLGARGTASYLNESGRRDGTSSLLAAYYSEHYATHEHLTVHLVLAASLGGGTHGVEAAVRSALQIGYRAQLTDVSGFFGRMGSHGLYTGNDALRLGLLEPLQARAGFQLLESARLLEVGGTLGIVPIGRFAVLDRGNRDLSGSVEVGGFFALQLAPVRFDIGFMRLIAPAWQPGARVDVLRGMLCRYRSQVTLCFDFLYARERVMQGLQGGFTVGFSP
jgi:hypothetical protein